LGSTRSDNDASKTKDDRDLMNAHESSLLEA
jgi:hypothetical protein